jgi:hypothetical protein
MTAQFLVEDALQIISSLSNTHHTSDSPSPSVFVRFLEKIFAFLKSLSFIQYSSQEQPLTSSDTSSERVSEAMQLLSKAAKSENSDAIYLLGELNFVRSLNPVPNESMAITLKRIIARRSNGSRNQLKKTVIQLRYIYSDLCTQQALATLLNPIRELYSPLLYRHTDDRHCYIIHLLRWEAILGQR